MFKFPGISTILFDTRLKRKWLRWWWQENRLISSIILRIGQSISWISLSLIAPYYSSSPSPTQKKERWLTLSSILPTPFPTAWRPSSSPTQRKAPTSSTTPLTSCEIWDWCSLTRPWSSSLTRPNTSLVFFHIIQANSLANLATEVKKVVVPKYSILLIPTVFTTSSSLIPKTKQEVSDCISKKACSLNKPGEKTHVLFIISKWRIRTTWVINGFKITMLSPSFLVSRTWNWNRNSLMLKSLDRSFVVRISPILPSYNDGFIDYGFGQTAYFEHLRLRGFHMQLIGNAFLVETPHEV